MPRRDSRGCSCSACRRATRTNGSDGLRSPRPSAAPRTRRRALQPPLELRERDEDPPAATNDPELVDDVLIEVVATDAEKRSGLVRAERETRPEFDRLRRGAGAARLRALGSFDPNHLELELLLRHAARHDAEV